MCCSFSPIDFFLYTVENKTTKTPRLLVSIQFCTSLSNTLGLLHLAKIEQLWANNHSVTHCYICDQGLQWTAMSFKLTTTACWSTEAAKSALFRENQRENNITQLNHHLFFKWKQEKFPHSSLQSCACVFDVLHNMYLKVSGGRVWPFKSNFGAVTSEYCSAPMNQVINQEHGESMCTKEAYWCHYEICHVTLGAKRSEYCAFDNLHSTKCNINLPALSQAPCGTKSEMQR